MPVVGFLGPTTPTAQSHWTAAFVQRLRELGWIEERTITIEYEWAEGRPERAADIAARFVQNKVDVIVTAGVGLVAAAQKATSTIPIVFAAHSDPVGTHAVNSLSHPGGNITGLSPARRPANLLGGRARNDSVNHLLIMHSQKRPRNQIVQLLLAHLIHGLVFDMKLPWYDRHTRKC
jgi:hypothetical protein